MDKYTCKVVLEFPGKTVSTTANLFAEEGFGAPYLACRKANREIDRLCTVMGVHDEDKIIESHIEYYKNDVGICKDLWK
jgi:hypothetical protein